jgi:hypothetical protein
MLTDGAARAVNPFKLYDWPSLLSALDSGGPSGIIKRVRVAESADPAGVRQPRNKINDDATVALVEL